MYKSGQHFMIYVYCVRTKEDIPGVQAKTIQSRFMAQTARRDLTTQRPRRGPLSLVCCGASSCAIGAARAVPAHRFWPSTTNLV